MKHQVLTRGKQIYNNQMGPERERVTQISQCFIRPKHTLDQHNQPTHLSVWDLSMLSVHYIQKGLLYSKPSQDFDVHSFLERLQDALSLTLVHFYTLSGRLVTTKRDDPDPSYVVYVDSSSNSPGAGFIHAKVDLTMFDILSPTYVPLVVQSFFDHDRAINHDGHVRPLLTIQVTELIDGIFVGCSLNHVVGDGSSFWHFFNSFSEIFKASHSDPSPSISRPPVIEPWFPDGYGPMIPLPFDPKNLVLPYVAPELKEKIFHLSSETIGQLKAKANSEHNTNKISSFQALSALVWRCIMRAYGFPREQTTSCRLAINNRHRLYPPLHENYLGNSIYPLQTSTTAGELLDNNLGFAAWLLHQSVVNHKDESIRKRVGNWLKSPGIYHLAQAFDPYSIMIGSSPRFNKYGVEFGLGKALALRSGYAHKFAGKVSGYPGHEGGGSVDLEICLPPDAMSRLEADKEFMDAVSVDKHIASITRPDV